MQLNNFLNILIFYCILGQAIDILIQKTELIVDVCVRTDFILLVCNLLMSSRTIFLNRLPGNKVEK